jgi:hypothetical protein
MAGRPAGMLNPDLDISECKPLEEEGDSELYTCPTNGLRKFDEMCDLGLIEVVFEVGETIIYEVVQ